jgi:hypothetical protein
MPGCEHVKLSVLSDTVDTDLLCLPVQQPLISGWVRAQ